MGLARGRRLIFCNQQLAGKIGQTKDLVHARRICGTRCTLVWLDEAVKGAGHRRQVSGLRLRVRAASGGQRAAGGVSGDGIQATLIFVHPRLDQSQLAL